MKAGGGRIGVFDSGVGGLTVLCELVKMLPAERFVYLGDTARVPYGTKSPETVRAYALEVGRFLAASGRRQDGDAALKSLVVACNTASSVALDDLRAELDIPVVGVIEPGAAEAARATRSKKVGVLATPATIASGAYRRALARFDTEIELVGIACPLFVPLAEEGWVDNAVARMTAKTYLEPFHTAEAEDVDVVILGCTHYPLLEPVIRELLGDGRVVVNSARAVAEAVASQIVEWTGPPSATSSVGGSLGERVSFYVTDAPQGFLRMAERFLGSSIDGVERVDLEGG